MDMTRGEFLRSLAVSAGGTMSGLAALGAGSAPSSGAEATRERDCHVTEELTKNAFTRNLNTTFRILDNESPTVIDVQLVEVREGRSTEQQEQYSLLFRGPAQPVLAQKTYGLEHSDMGRFSLFLVPVAADESGTTYEAVFNRLRQ
jgi:hypothetical protein